MYTRLFKKTCAYAPAYLHVCMANVHALMSNTHSHASNLLCALLKHTLKQTVECRNYMAPSFVFFRQCALPLRHIQRKYLCLKHSESSGNNSFLGFLMKKDFFYLSSACVFINTQTNAWLRSWQQQKKESLVCAFVSFSACVLLIPSCSCFHVLCTQWYSVLAAGWVKNKKMGGQVQTEGGCVNMMCVLVCLQGKNLKNQEMTDM